VKKDQIERKLIKALALCQVEGRILVIWGEKAADYWNWCVLSEGRAFAQQGEGGGGEAWFSSDTRILFPEEDSDRDSRAAKISKTREEDETVLSSKGTFD